MNTRDELRAAYGRLREFIEQSSGGVLYDRTIADLKLLGEALATAWQPPAEVWARMPTKARWIVGRPDGLFDVWAQKPQLFPDCWWAKSGYVLYLEEKLPIGVDWRLAIWERDGNK